MFETHGIFSLAALGFGAIIGSFLNVLVLRYGTGRSALAGRSRCARCAHPLAAGDLVPVFSFLFLRGRCRYCKSKISFQYPLVEAAAALLALLIFLEHSDPLAFLFWFVVWMTLLFITVYDLRHMIIPQSASIFLGILALVYIWSLGFEVWSFAAGPLLALPLFLLSFVSKGRWMGWADSGLQLSLGWLLGLSTGLTGLVLAFWSGAAVGIVLTLSSKRPASPKTSSRGGYTMKSEIPFAPFLVLGAAVAIFLHVDFFSTFAL